MSALHWKNVKRGTSRVFTRRLEQESLKVKANFSKKNSNF